MIAEGDIFYSVVWVSILSTISTFMYILWSVISLSYIFQSILMNFMIYAKIIHLNMNDSNERKRYLGNINVTCYKTQGSANL